MCKTCTRVELPQKYNESERKRGRSCTAIYRVEEDDWFFVVDLNLSCEKGVQNEAKQIL